MADAASAVQHAEQDSVSAAAPTEYSPPAVQDFYMLTSRPRVNLAGSSMLPAPLRISLLTDSDMLALQQHAQQQQQQWHGPAPHSSSGGGCGYDEPPELDFDFDLFCSSSVGRDMMSLSLVVRESAELDNVFVGLTTPSQSDQRGLQVGGGGPLGGDRWCAGKCCAVLRCVVCLLCHIVCACLSLKRQSVTPAVPICSTHSWLSAAVACFTLLLQIPSFGFHQVTACPADAAGAPDTNADSLDGQQPKQQRWATGDLVQLVLDRRSSSGNSLSLTVNNQSSSAAAPPAADSITSSISGMINSGSSSGSSAGGSSVSLPAFEEWVWYIALYRGTQVVALVLDQHSYAVYTGDSKLKRYLS